MDQKKVSLQPQGHLFFTLTKHTAYTVSKDRLRGRKGG